jgi:hypothetical protein
MKNDELLLVTGATGFLGMHLVNQLLDQAPELSLALLIRDKPGQSGRQRAESFLPRQHLSRVQVISLRKLPASFIPLPPYVSTTHLTKHARPTSKAPATYSTSPLHHESCAALLTSEQLTLPANVMVWFSKVNLPLVRITAIRTNSQSQKPKLSSAPGWVLCPASSFVQASSSATHAPALHPASK